MKILTRKPSVPTEAKYFMNQGYHCDCQMYLDNGDCEFYDCGVPQDIEKYQIISINNRKLAMIDNGVESSIYLLNPSNEDIIDPFQSCIDLVLKENFIYVRMIRSIPICDFGNVETLKYIMDTIKEVGSKLNVNYIDLQDDASFCDKELRAIFYRCLTNHLDTISIYHKYGYRPYNYNIRLPNEITKCLRHRNDTFLSLIHEIQAIENLVAITEMVSIRPIVRFNESSVELVEEGQEIGYPTRQVASLKPLLNLIEQYPDEKIRYLSDLGKECKRVKEINTLFSFRFVFRVDGIIQNPILYNFYKLFILLTKYFEHMKLIL